MIVKNLIEFVNKFYKFPHTHTDVQKTHCILDLHSYKAAYCTLSLRVALVVVYNIIVCIPYPSSQNDMHLFHSCVIDIHSQGSSLHESQLPFSLMSNRTKPASKPAR